MIEFASLGIWRLEVICVFPVLISKFGVDDNIFAFYSDIILNDFIGTFRIWRYNFIIPGCT